MTWLARWTGPVILLSILAFLFGFVVFSERIASMRTPVDVEYADAIVVLTGGQSRLETAIGLLANRKAKRLLISGAHPATSKKDLANAVGANKTLFECCVDLGYQAKDTVGNAVETIEWLKTNNFNSVILVTNNYHLPRSLLEISRIGPSVDVRSFPVVNTDMSNGKWMLRKEAVRVLLAEYTKYLGAKLRVYLPIPNSLSSLLED